MAQFVLLAFTAAVFVAAVLLRRSTARHVRRAEDAAQRALDAQRRAETARTRMRAALDGTNTPTP